MKKKGSVLVQVLMTAVIVAIIAAGLMQMLTQRATIVKRAADSASARKKAEGALALITTRWNQVGQVCAGGVPNYNTIGSPGICSCTYTPLVSTDPTVSAGLDSSGRCRLTVVSDP